MAETTDLHKFQATILRVPLDPSARQNLRESPSWTNFIAMIDKEPNWRFVGQGWAVEECQLVLLIGWKVDHEPSATFLPATRSKLDDLLAPLQSFHPKTPDIFNMSCVAKDLSCKALMTERSGVAPALMEMVTVAGPLSLVEPVVNKIETDLKEYCQERSFYLTSSFTSSIWYDFWGFVVFRLDKNEAGTPEEPDSDVSFALFFEWHNEKCRAEFQDPNLEDDTSGMDVPDDFWETTVAVPLRELVERGARVSSWDYREANYIYRVRGMQKMMREPGNGDRWLEKAK